MKLLVLAALSTPAVTIVHPSDGMICAKNEMIEVSKCERGSVISCDPGRYFCDSSGLPTRSETKTHVIVVKPSVHRRLRRAPLHQKSILDLLFRGR